MNKHARALGKLGAGKPKSYSRAERLRRRQRMKNMHARLRKKKVSSTKDARRKSYRDSHRPKGKRI